MRAKQSNQRVGGNSYGEATRLGSEGSIPGPKTEDYGSARNTEIGGNRLTGEEREAVLSAKALGRLVMWRDEDLF